MSRDIDTLVVVKFVVPALAGSVCFFFVIVPEGVEAISRWLRPPEIVRLANAPQRGASKLAFFRWHPVGVQKDYVFSTGGVASLNHRLIAVTPSEYF